MARSSLSWKYERDGPFFRNDPRKTFRRNVRDFMDEVAELGEREVKAQVPVHTGALRQGIVGRTSNLSGKRWAVTAVVSATHVYPWANPNPAQAQYRGGKVAAPIFKKVTSRIRRARTDLLRGLR